MHYIAGHTQEESRNAPNMFSFMMNYNPVEILNIINKDLLFKS